MSENQRKRVKTEFLEIDELSNVIDTTTDNTYDVTDDLNAAFLSSIEDEVIEPTQFNQTKIRNLKINGCEAKEKESKSLETKERSPTVLSKRRNKVRYFHIFYTEIEMLIFFCYQTVSNEAPEWRSKALSKNNAPRRLFNSKYIVYSNSSTQYLEIRKKNELKAQCLKQSMINFPKVSLF